MRIISNSHGDYVQVLEEFSNTQWMIVLKFGKVMLYNRFRSPDCFTPQEFIEFKIESENFNWRNKRLKEEKIKIYNQIEVSIVKWNREMKLDKIFSEETRILLC